MKPFDPALNRAVHTIVNLLMPRGYLTVSQGAPETLADCTSVFTSRRVVMVWDGESDNTIYGDPQTNWAARAWHDWCHIMGQHEFNLAGEAATAEMQIAHLRAFADDYNPAWDALIRAEVVAQAALYEATGEFPKDQRKFVAGVCGLDLPD